MLVNKINPGVDFDTIGQINEGYIQRWKGRHGLDRGQINGESLSSDTVAAQIWTRDEFPKIIQEFGLDDLLNFDEFGLFYERGMNHSLQKKGQNQHGFKQSKKRVTISGGASATGKKYPQLIIGKAKYPFAFRNHFNRTFKFTNQKNAWINSPIFNNHLNDINLELIKKDKRIGVVIDFCSGHSTINTEYSNITIFYLPPNATPLIQSMDAGIIASVKKRYKTEITNKRFYDIITGKDTVIDLYYSCTLIQRIWDETTPETIKHCFRKA
ncbi:MAG: putative Tigger transposable element-derived protein 6 [Streblomastix strix]|uniref:Putative Tigger transposable element-derived protein 6 n=1 Tax=Streblomastix strix TaxID=222440 RepID=A0A5J4WCT6_9EUKA|nr:MAG: putative Tigger transposable element-derived protein 6 [Streblomastix strix]